MVASDISALLGRTRRLYTLADDQLAELTAGNLRVETMSGAPVEPIALSVDWDLAAAEKGGYEDFMSKEIHEQPRAVADTLLDRQRPDGSLALDEYRDGADFATLSKVHIVACGSSYHAGLLAKYAIEQWARLPAEVDVASEFRYRDPVVDDKTLAVGISQSGESLDTLQALREAARLGARVLAVTNVVDSSMARESEAVLYTRAGPEICVAATKTLLAQIVALDLLALTLAQGRGTMAPQAIAETLARLAELPGLLEEVLSRSKEVDTVAKAVDGANHFFFLGRHVGYPVALEGALKLKELSYLHAEGYPAGELKHGPIALIEPGTVVVGLATRNPLWEKFRSNVAEVKSRGATVVLVANDGDERVGALADHVLWVPEAEPILSPVLDIVPLQLFAYRLARLAGRDVDRPRNLAKTVTVE
jgi:glutamine---fructose-6-phosphate transaminase (isomerizing)